MERIAGERDESAVGSRSRAALLTAIPALERVLLLDGFVLAAILLVAFAVYGDSLFIHPLNADNLYALSVAHRGNPGTFFTAAAHGTPFRFFRPVSDLTLWLQYRALGLQVQSFFFVNILIWVACAWAVYVFVRIATGQRVFAAIAALATILDSRGILTMLWVVERQSSLALLLGFSALIITLAPPERLRPSRVWGGAFVLLLGAALSKEYALAFVVAVPLMAYLRRTPGARGIGLAALGTVVVYVILRFAVAGGALGRYCEQMGYFRSTRTVCYSNYTQLSQLDQHLYNAGASFFGTVVPPLFDSFGALVTPSIHSLVIPLVVLAGAIVGFVKRPLWTIPLLSLVVCNALLNFVLYRPRNQAIGMAALYAASAIGFGWIAGRERLRLWRWAPVLAVGCAVVVTGWLSWNAVLRPRTVNNFEQLAGAADPCTALRDYPADVSPAVVRALSGRYHLKLSCAPASR